MMRLEFKRHGVAGVLALLLLGTGTAQAALFEDDEARRAILDLRQRLEATNNALKAQADDSAQLRRILVELQAQIDNMQAELNKSRGAQEQLTRDLSDMQLRQRDAQTGLDERLRKFEPATISLDGREFQVDPVEKRDYDAAMEIFRKGDFAAAQVSLQRFVQRYPQTGYMPSALFWLGNASYAVKDYKASLTQFRQMLNLSPSHGRAPEAMLAISNVQIELKDTKAARKTLEDLIKAYPQSDAAQAARDRLPKLR
ncbi:tol-pal system protein YbgF [Limnohabitans sp.]|uniref:tol-pal system protein YbgF n=1 Tax=Limnohabitans sp. TaxID=1907725 RepID=UPI0035B4F27F